MLPIPSSITPDNVGEGDAPKQRDKKAREEQRDERVQSYVQHQHQEKSDGAQDEAREGKRRHEGAWFREALAGSVALGPKRRANRAGKRLPLPVRRDLESVLIYLSGSERP